MGFWSLEKDGWSYCQLCALKYVNLYGLCIGRLASTWRYQGWEGEVGRNPEPKYKTPRFAW